MAKRKAARRERKSAKFTQKHPELPKNAKFASRKEWAKVKRVNRKNKKVEKRQRKISRQRTPAHSGNTKVASTLPTGII